MRTTNYRPIPLHQAGWHFATPDQRAKAKEERAEPPLTLKVPGHLDLGPKRRVFEGMVEVMNGFARLTHDMVNPRAPSPEMNRRLVRLIAGGKLQAIGIRTNPRNGSGLQPIPSYIFKGRPSIFWLKDTVENFEERYEAVEVSRVTTPKVSAITTRKNPQGRPSKSDQIEQAITGLLKHGKKLDEMPRKIAGEMIREYVRGELGASAKNGYSEPVLQRHLFRRFGKRI